MSREITLFGVAVMMVACSQQGATKQPLTKRNAAAVTIPNHPPDLTGWPIFDRKSRRVGTVVTRLQKQGVLVSLDTMGLPPGVHGVHIHQIPRCDAPAFDSAGEHWNWKHKKHGLKNPQGHHAGDLGNLTVGPDGKGQAAFLIASKDWDAKAPPGLPIVIHAHADDEKTDPSGNSGERIACGVLHLRRD